MLLSKYFVFVHFPRIGGTFIRKTLEKYMPEDSAMVVQPGHDTVNDIPDEYRDVPRFGFIRNPWDWYVSVYSGWRGVKKNRPNAFEGHRLDKITEGDPDISFNVFLTRLLGDDLPERNMLWVYQNIYALEADKLDVAPSNIAILRYEHLREELLDYLAATGMPISIEMEQAIKKDPPINNFDRKPYIEYYDDELVDLVFNRDREIIELYGYSFG